MINDLTLHQASELLQTRQISSRELVSGALDKIELTDSTVRAFLTVTAETALAQADAIDERRARGDALPPLAGIPVALKDNLCTRDVKTTCASHILHNFVPPYSATAVERLSAAGAISVGKTNLDEFAMGSSTENSAFGPTTNPWNRETVPGGSSGGSAAAVSAGHCLGALGSDTGGSIRQPASFCGIVGMKPTYGRVSRYGLVAYASSLDQIGPMARTVKDCALLLSAISGHDPKDSTSVEAAVPDFAAACGGDVRGLRIGVPAEYFEQGVSAEVASAVRTAIRQLKDLGATVGECSLEYTKHSLAAYYIIAPAEAGSNLARFDGVKYGLRTAELSGHIGVTERSRDEGFGDEVKQRIMIGAYVLSAGYYDAYYRRAQQVRTLIRRDFDRAFESFDIIAAPTAPTAAFRLGEKSDPLEMKLADVCTIPANLAGIPGISVPCGFSGGLPIGLQLLAKPFDEVTLFRAAHAYEQASGWSARRPLIAQ